MLLWVTLSGSQVMVNAGGAPVRMAVIVADPPGEIVESPLATAVGTMIATVCEPEDCVAHDDVTVTLKTTVPEQFAVYVIALEEAAEVIEPPVIVQEYVAPDCTGTEALP